MNPPSADWIYEKLHTAIMKAITSSEEVREILRDLQSGGRIDDMAVMNIILSLEELSESITSVSHPVEEKPVELKAHEENFDENRWLKKVGIKF